MKKLNRTWLFFTVLLACCIGLSCGNDAIFHAVSLEDTPRNSIIQGSPGNFAVSDSTVYAWGNRANNVWAFGFDRGEGRWKWNPLTQPGASVEGLAVVKNELFAVVDSGNVSRIMKFLHGQWVTIHTDHRRITRLFSTNNKIFARAEVRGNSEEHAILVFDSPTGNNQAAVHSIITGNGDVNLRGIAELSGDIYIATGQAGIFRVPTTTPAASIVSAMVAVSPRTNFVITGIIETTNEIVVVGNSNSSSHLYAFKATELSDPPNSALWDSPVGDPGVSSFTGALSFWSAFDSGSNTWVRRLLLVGVGINTTRFGYREIALDNTGDVNLGSTPLLRSPGNRNEVVHSSLSIRERYNANIGNRALRFILQAPNLKTLDGIEFFPPKPDGWEPPIFASTTRHGLFVYYFGDDQWRAEDNTINWR
ncbi:MAG: hypothetical protein FWD91_03515 [Treponema sp.]|nr:hypothetical protein [Treponema sp.]